MSLAHSPSMSWCECNMLNVGKGRLLMLIRLLLRCRAVALLDGSAALQAEELPPSVSARGATENRTDNA